MFYCKFLNKPKKDNMIKICDSLFEASCTEGHLQIYTQVPLESSTCSANTSTCSYVHMCFFPFSPLENRQSRTILRLSPGLWINPSFSGYKDGPLCTPRPEMKCISSIYSKGYDVVKPPSLISL